MNDTQEDLTTDDELLRVQGMTDGIKRVSKFTLRPVTALSLSWMQRNGMFDDSYGDMIMKTGAFVYLHTADKASIRGVVNDRNSFLNAVDDWLDENIRHHSELEPMSVEMTNALDRYMAAVTTAVHPSDGLQDSRKN